MEKTRRSHTVHVQFCHDPQQPRREAKLMGGAAFGARARLTGTRNARWGGPALGSSQRAGSQVCAPGGCPVPVNCPLRRVSSRLGSGSES